MQTSQNHQRFYTAIPPFKATCDQTTAKVHLRKVETLGLKPQNPPSISGAAGFACVV